MPKEIAKLWMFTSSSGNQEYETLKYTDGTTSCNCPGWCFMKRTTADGQRSCKHTRLVDRGVADRECIDSTMYDVVEPASEPASEPAAAVVDTAVTRDASVTTVLKRTRRKVRWGT